MSYRISPNSRYKQSPPANGATAANHFDSAPTGSNSNAQNPMRPTRGSPKSVQARTDPAREQPADRTAANEDESTAELTESLPSPQAVQQSNGTPDKPTEKSPDGRPSKDSPAFRLRTRRSTPRKLDSIYSSPYSTSRKSSLYSPTNSEQLQAKVAKLKSAPAAASPVNVKRNLFDVRPANGPGAKKGRSHSPSRSLVEDVDLNVFAENIRVEKLTEAGKNSLNYLCLRIIEVLNEEWLTECSSDCTSGRTVSSSKCSPNNGAGDRPTENHKLTDPSERRSNDHPSSPVHQSSPIGSSTGDCSSCPKQRLLKIYCQQAETNSILNAQKPVVLLQLLNEYCNFKDRLMAGKILEIVKFEVKRLPQPANYRHSTGEVPVFPFYIEVRANKDRHWVSYLSIKKKYEPINSNLLNVINTQNKHQMHIEDQPPTKNPRVVFSSYVVNEPANEQACQPLKNTNSPTIRRFMKKMINKSVK